MSGDGGYAIWQAAHKGDRDGLTRLVELGMDVNARDEVSTTTLRSLLRGGARGPGPLVPWYPSPNAWWSLLRTGRIHSNHLGGGEWHRMLYECLLAHYSHLRAPLALQALAWSSLPTHLLQTNSTGPLSVPVCVRGCS